MVLTKLQNLIYQIKDIINIRPTRILFSKNKNNAVIDKEHIFNDARLDEVNLIVSPSVLYFKNINSNYFNKCKFIPFSYNEQNNKIFSIQSFESFLIEKN